MDTGGKPPSPPLTEDAVLDAIYACAVDPETWPELLEALTALEAENPAALAEMRRHFERAITLSDRIPAPPIGSAETSDGPAVIELDARRRIESVNGPARSALADLFETLRNGARLSPRDADFEERLEEAVKVAQRSGSAPLIVRAPNVALRLVYVVAREQGGCSIIAKGDAPQVKAEPDLASLNAFSLTPAEMRLIQRLRSGERVREAAEALGVSEHTARTQLKTIYSKLGINRQPELTRVIDDAAALAPVLRPAAVAMAGAPGRAPPRKTLVLPDGRTLAYRTYGDPSGAPVLYIQGAVQASMLPSDHDALTAQAGAFLVAFDRPGMGGSTRNPGRRPSDVAEDAKLLMDHLGIRKFSILSALGGSPYALACAKVFGEHVPGILLLNPHFMAAPSGLIASNPGPLLKLLRNNNWIAMALTRFMSRPLTRPYMERQIVKLYAMCEQDHRAFEDARLRADLYDMVVDMMHLDTSGIFDDATHEATREEIATKTPISVWWAEHDPMTRDATVRERLKDYNGVREHTVPDLGRMVIYLRWGDLVAEAVRMHQP